MSPASTTPVNDLYLYQIGSESTWGTEVAQTAKLGLMEELEFDPEIEALIMKDKRASLAPGYESALLKSTGSAEVVAEVLRKVEHIGHLVEAVIPEQLQLSG